MSTAGKVLNRIILLRLQGAVDATLRDQQAGFRKDHSCIDQIATLRIIIEQSIEWNTSLYVNFIDFEKAFDSLDRSVLWCLMRHYGIPGKFIRIIKNSYDKMTCRVLHASGLSDSFAVNTGVKQGCLMAPFLFLLAMDWIMKETTREQRNGIQWNLLEQLEDLEFADDIALVSSNNQQMQDKTARLTANSIKLGLHPNVSKTKVMKVNCTNNRPVKVRDTILEEVTSFVYLGSVVSIDGGSDEDIKVRINKARVAFNMLRKVWSSHVISRRTKFRIFNTNVKAVLLYGSETWRTTNQTSQKLQTFVNKCLRRILKISWTDRVTNEMLWELAGEEPIITQISKRKWRWIGHILRKPANNITRQALRWNPQGKRKRGRPRNSWRRDLQRQSLSSMNQMISTMTSAMETFTQARTSRKRKRGEISESDSSDQEDLSDAGMAGNSSADISSQVNDLLQSTESSKNCSKANEDEVLGELSKLYESEGMSKSRNLEQGQIEYQILRPEDAKACRTSLLKSMIPIVKISDKLLELKSNSKSASESDVSEFLQLSPDSLAHLGHSINEVNIKRRELIKPDLNDQFKQLCCSHTPVTKLLFGDDLPTSVKEIFETNIVGVKVSSKPPTHYTKQQKRSNFSHRTHHQSQKPFLWKYQEPGKRSNLDPKKKGKADQQQLLPNFKTTYNLGMLSSIKGVKIEFVDYPKQTMISREYNFDATEVVII
ncbi:Retrovirus-related Pol polyprotein from type-2 retrotransposable element R2DM [Stylophora pistillata]|uniref:Retrovirus-related Pol polyprotein from type-2 retrotransposable element R2DM n=1 Tax=Stylophora pistillata TaxID=50429 RepID=A0A2B4S265_STYPI|nr:Retrovirus-related Pol polyprotein from type-2 retrotransposable element R2DM [Stylophora pistillata]